MSELTSSADKVWRKWSSQFINEKVKLQVNCDVFCSLESIVLHTADGIVSLNGTLFAPFEQKGVNC